MPCAFAHVWIDTFREETAASKATLPSLHSPCSTGTFTSGITGICEFFTSPYRHRSNHSKGIPPDVRYRDPQHPSTADRDIHIMPNTLSHFSLVNRHFMACIFFPVTLSNQTVEPCAQIGHIVESFYLQHRFTHRSLGHPCAMFNGQDSPIVSGL